MSPERRESVDWWLDSHWLHRLLAQCLGSLNHLCAKYKTTDDNAKTNVSQKNPNYPGNPYYRFMFLVLHRSSWFQFTRSMSISPYVIFVFQLRRAGGRAGRGSGRPGRPVPGTALQGRLSDDLRWQQLSMFDDGFLGYRRCQRRQGLLCSACKLHGCTNWRMYNSLEKIFTPPLTLFFLFRAVMM